MLASATFHRRIASIGEGKGGEGGREEERFDVFPQPWLQLSFTTAVYRISSSSRSLSERDPRYRLESIARYVSSIV